MNKFLIGIVCLILLPSSFALIGNIGNKTIYNTNIETNDSYNYAYNGSDWLGMQSTPEGILRLDVGTSTTIYNYSNPLDYHILYSLFANISNIMDNQTILSFINANYITNYPNNATIRSVLSGGNGITYNASTGTISSTSTNGTFYTGGRGIVVSSNVISTTATNGSITNITQIRYLGIDCTGNDGDVNRQLTTTRPQMVSVDSAMLSPIDDYTVAGDIVTFLRRIWDSQIINVWSTTNPSISLSPINYLGIDCTGNDGDASRTLSIDSMTSVVVDNQVLSINDDYTFSGGLLTFNKKIWDSQRITIWRIV